MHFHEILNFPLIHRCPELGLLIDQCSTKELQDCFPILINSIFNGNGWGLRTIIREISLQEFDTLYHFFIPLGPMFRLCYRLLNEPIKFEVPIEILPKRMSEMLQTGRYPDFYSNMITIDPLQRKIVSLSMNAFDYFILHFTLYGMEPLHTIHPGALAIHNEKWKTVYFYLTAEYVCAFLPNNPDTVVMPSNICGTTKITTSMPIQPLQPTRSPKYLRLSALSHNFTSGPTVTVRQPESSRLHSWRTESVLYLFIDTWLRYSVDEKRELPSSEFIRVVRILVKQLHGFGNAAELDHTSMESLRKLAQPMLNIHMYTFLRDIISRWPLDSSFSVVQELWLSYIQPWRYKFDFRTTMLTHPDIPIPRKFESFILENLISYTQIFIQLLPRFERLDFASVRSVLMMSRVLKVFSQSNLSDILRHHEQTFFLNGKCIPPINRSGGSGHHISPVLRKSPYNSGSSFNRSGDSIDQWTSLLNDSNNHDNYVCLFGVPVQEQLKQLMRKIVIVKEFETERVKDLERQYRQQSGGFSRYIRWFFVSDKDLEYEKNIQECLKIPELLENITLAMSCIFQIELPESHEVDAISSQYSWNGQQDYEFEESDLDRSNSICPSPSIMKRRQASIKYMGDPALKPIQSNEVTFLVRFLYQLSAKLNIMFSAECNRIWHRNDFWGRIGRQILTPPMVIETLTNLNGLNELSRRNVGARINLRPLATYNVLMVIAGFLLFGYLWFGAPTYGLMSLLCLSFLYLTILSIFNDPIHN